MCGNNIHGVSSGSGITDTKGADTMGSKLNVHSKSSSDVSGSPIVQSTSQAIQSNVESTKALISTLTDPKPGNITSSASLISDMVVSALPQAPDTPPAPKLTTTEGIKLVLDALKPSEQNVAAKTIFDPEKGPRLLDSAIKSFAPENIVFIKQLQVTMTAVSDPSAGNLKAMETMQNDLDKVASPGFKQPEARNLSAPTDDSQRLQFLKSNIVDKFIGPNASVSTINISGSQEKAILEAVKNNDLPGLLTALSDSGTNVLSMVTGNDIKVLGQKDVAGERVSEAIKDKPASEQKVVLESIIKGDLKLSLDSTQPNYVSDFAKAKLADVKNTIENQAKAETALNPVISRLPVGRGQVVELQKYITGEKTIKGIDPEALKAKASEMKEKMVNSYVSDIPINSSADMDRFVKTFNKGTSNWLGTSFNPEMKKVNAALAELQQVVKNNPGDDPMSQLAKFEALTKLQEAAQNFVKECPTSSKIDLVSALVPKTESVPKPSAVLTKEITDSTVKNIFNSPAQHQTGTIKLSEILHDPAKLQVFHDYCATEHSTENTDFLSEIKTAFTNHPIPTDAQLDKIYSKFIAPPDSSPDVAINISHSSKVDLKNAYSAVPRKTEDIVKALDSAIDELTRMLKDTMGRFVRSPSGEKLIADTDKKIAQEKIDAETLLKNLENSDMGGTMTMDEALKFVRNKGKEPEITPAQQKMLKDSELA